MSSNLIQINVWLPRITIQFSKYRVWMEFWSKLCNGVRDIEKCEFLKEEQVSPQQIIYIWKASNLLVVFQLVDLENILSLLNTMGNCPSIASFKWVIFYRCWDVARGRFVTCARANIFIGHGIGIFFYGFPFLATRAEKEPLYSILPCVQWAYILYTSFVVNGSTGPTGAPNYYTIVYTGMFGTDFK